MITQTFQKLSEKIVKSLQNKEIKSLIGRSRLKFTKKQILSYVFVIFEHSLEQRTFKYLYKKHQIKVDYSVFMKQIALFSKLFYYIFYQINHELLIKASSLLNVVDTTLIEEKSEAFINDKDWEKGRVTIRKNKKTQEKSYICGQKGLVFLNRFNQVYSASLMSINDSDQNIFKNCSHHVSQLKGIVLADRGFSNKAVRQRLSQQRYFAFQTQSSCRLISPYHYKEKKTLTHKERKIYKRRWKIETLFQKLKHHYSEHKLNLKGIYQTIIKTAKFYATLIAYNISATI